MLPILPQVIYQTLAYADIFDYPLTASELWKLLIKGENITFQRCKTEIKNIKGVRCSDGYYFLNGRENIVRFRKERENWSKGKLILAKQIVALLRFIPTIRMIGLTGALSVQNAKQDDDIDILIVTSSKLFWTTRLLSTLLVELTGKRRHPKDTQVNNKICLNMFVAEDKLTIPEKERDLYTAHEVVQMKPIWEKNNIYIKWLQSNLWAKDFLPNALNSQTTNFSRESSIKILRHKIGINNRFFDIEKTLKKIQLWYMKNRHTTEVVKDGFIRFHPDDARKWVLRKYQERLKELHKNPKYQW